MGFVQVMFLLTHMYTHALFYMMCIVQTLRNIYIYVYLCEEIKGTDHTLTKKNLNYLVSTYINTSVNHSQQAYLHAWVERISTILLAVSLKHITRSYKEPTLF